MSKPKPQIQTEVAVVKIYPKTRCIVFDGSTDSFTHLSEFGRIEKDGFMPSRYDLFVDGRYDFDDVVDYVNNYR